MEEKKQQKEEEKLVAVIKVRIAIAACKLKIPWYIAT